jgi:heptosyltransferase-3
MTPLLFSVRIPTLLAIFWRKWLARTEEVAATPRSILVFRLDQLGDVVLTTPLFRELKRMYPTARCTAVVQPAYRAILTTNHSVDEILPLNEVKATWLPARALRLVSALWFYWTRLKGRRFDLAISPRWDVDESLATMLCVLTNAGRRVGHSEQTSKAKRRVNRGFDGAFDVMAPPGPVRHEVDRNLAIVEALGGRIEDRRLEICLTANDRKFASELLTHHERDRILVAIGIGGRASSRKWPSRNYGELIAQMNRHMRVQPILVCAREEEAEAEKLADLLVVSRHPQGGDPDHANSPARFAPRCSWYRVVQPAMGAGDCTRSCGATEPHCITLVTAEMAVSAALELLCLKPPLAIQQASSSSGILPAVVHVADEVSVPQAAGAL